MTKNDLEALDEILRRVRMTDHANDCDGPDRGYLMGCISLIQLRIKQMRERKEIAKKRSIKIEPENVITLNLKKYD